MLVNNKYFSFIEQDKLTLKLLKVDIDNALNNSKTGIIKQIDDEHKSDIFYMICFCIFVPQSKAVKADECINILKNKDFLNQEILFNDLSFILRGLVRFHNNKSKYTLYAKDVFTKTDFFIQLKNYYQSYSLNNINLYEVRDWISQSLKGVSLKASTHLMRNIGLCGLAILDVHILDGLKKRYLIPNVKFSLTRNKYLEIEKIMLAYANDLGASIDELDLLLWREKTGYIFK